MGICVKCYFLISGSLGANEFHDWLLILASILSIAATCMGFFGLIASIFEPAIDTDRVKYVVRLNDDYSVNEFYDKYKVLEHTKYTDVYTVEEIKND